MKRIRTTGLFVCLWAALTLAASARAAASSNPAAAALMTLFWAAVQGAGLWFARSHDAPPERKVTDGIAAFGLCAFVLELLTGTLLQALMSLVLWLQAARNPALATRRDAYFALVISLTLIIFGAAETRSTMFLLVMVAYGLCALGVLVYCHQQSGFDQEMETEAASGKGPLWSLSLPHLAALGGGVFLIALFWYLLVPRPAPINFGAVPTQGGHNYSRKDWEREARSNTSQNEEEDSSGEGAKGKDAAAAQQRNRPGESNQELDITRSDHSAGGKDKEEGAKGGNGIVMYVQADRMLYLRERSYDRFQNNRWSSSENPTRKLVPERGKFNLASRADGEKVQYAVQVVSRIKDNLPLSAHAQSIEAPADVIAQGRDGAVYLPERIEPGFRYRATSLLPLNSERPVARDVQAERANYLQLPAEYSPRIGELARQVSANAAAPFDKALALETHLRTKYAYSFETIFTSQNVTPLEEFLFETRRGHCEFFASAMAIMLREIGIPSRVVHGYLAHGFNPVTGLYEVRAFDGHAWVEAYLEGSGWMSFEPTAAYPVPQRQQQSGTTLADLKTYAEKLAQQEAMQGEKSVLQIVAEVLRSLTEAWYLLLFHLQAWFDVLQAWVAAHALALGVALSGAVLGGFAAYRQRVWLLWLWAWFMMRRASESDVPLAAFRQLERVARARKLGKAACETVEEYLERLEQAYAELRVELRVLRRAFNARRYGGKRLTTDDTQTVLRAFHTICAAVKAR